MELIPKLSYQQCSGRQEKSFQDYYLRLFIEFVFRRECPGQNLGYSFKPFKKPEFIIAVENGQLMVKVSPCYHWERCVEKVFD